MTVASIEHTGGKTGDCTGVSRSVEGFPRPPLDYTPELAEEMAPLYAKVSKVIPPMEWPQFAPYIKAINGNLFAHTALARAAANVSALTL